MQPATIFHEMKKKITGKGNRREVELIEQSKAIDERTRQLNAVVAKIQMDDISSDEEELEESDYNETELASESDSSDFDFYKDKLFQWFICI